MAESLVFLMHEYQAESLFFHTQGPMAKNSLLPWKEGILALTNEWMAHFLLKLEQKGGDSDRARDVRIQIVGVKVFALE